MSYKQVKKNKSSSENWGANMKKTGLTFFPRTPFFSRWLDLLFSIAIYIYTRNFCHWMREHRRFIHTFLNQPARGFHISFHPYKHNCLTWKIYTSVTSAKSGWSAPDCRYTNPPAWNNLYVVRTRLHSLHNLKVAFIITFSITKMNIKIWLVEVFLRFFFMLLKITLFGISFRSECFKLHKKKFNEHLKLLKK